MKHPWTLKECGYKHFCIDCKYYRNGGHAYPCAVCAEVHNTKTCYWEPREDKTEETNED